MATYPIKMMKDEDGTPFVPLCGANGIVYDDKETLQEKLDKKLEKTNLIAGNNIIITKVNNDCTISTDSSASLIKN